MMVNATLCVFYHNETKIYVGARNMCIPCCVRHRCSVTDTGSFRECPSNVLRDVNSTRPLHTREELTL